MKVGILIDLDRADRSVQLKTKVQHVMLLIAQGACCAPHRGLGDEYDWWQ